MNKNKKCVKLPRQIIFITFSSMIFILFEH